MDSIIRRAIAVATGTVAVVLLSGCGGPSAADEDCAAAFERAALSVDQVASAEFECESPFGNPSQEGTITLAVRTQEQATPVMEEVYKAFAADGELRDAWRPTLTFEAESGTGRFDEADFEFNGRPSISVLRDRWGIDSSVSE